jgi:hypothetical protein
MAFKLNNPPYTVDNTPIYKVDMEQGVMGKANNNGTILLDKNLSEEDSKKVIAHEKIHLEQMKRGDLDYDDKYVYWKGNKYSRAQMQEGAKNLPWEAEAYRRA